MKSSFLNPGKPFQIQEIEDIAIKDDEVLLKVESCAICGSDLKIAKHGNHRITSRRTIGHEISGIISKIGSKITNFVPGDKVSVGADLPCLECESCRIGEVNNCETNLAIGYQFNGGFAEYILLNKHVLNGGPIQKFTDTSYDLACLAEPLACAINGVEKSLGCFPRSLPRSALIFGGGPMGLLLAEYLKFLKVESIFILEVNQDRKNFISENTGFSLFNNHDLKFDLIFTACPILDTHIQSLDLIAKSGVINFFGGLPIGANNLSIESNFIHYNEICLTGSHGSNPRQHKIALDLIENGSIDLEYLITHRFCLDEINEAFDLARSGKGQKIIVKP